MLQKLVEFSDDFCANSKITAPRWSDSALSHKTCVNGNSGLKVM